MESVEYSRRSKEACEILLSGFLLWLAETQRIENGTSEGSHGSSRVFQGEFIEIKYHEK